MDASDLTFRGFRLPRGGVLGRDIEKRRSPVSGGGSEGLSLISAEKVSVKLARAKPGRNFERARDTLDGRGTGIDKQAKGKEEVAFISR